MHALRGLYVTNSLPFLHPLCREGEGDGDLGQQALRHVGDHDADAKDDGLQGSVAAYIGERAG
jgi:hypothetical protein